jgi:Protein of unknown function (DUF4065)
MLKKTNKLMEATMAVLQSSPDRQLNIVVLNKALFYLDLYALRDLGQAITEQDYVALPQGPVVDGYRSAIIRPLTEAGLAEQIQVNKAKPVRVVKQLARWDHLSGTELSIAQQVGASFTPLTSTAVSRFSHENPGWRLAYRSYVPGGPFPKINMRLALQQLCEDDDDPWLDEPLDTATMALCEKAGTATRSWE